MTEKPMNTVLKLLFLSTISLAELAAMFCSAYILEPNEWFYVCFTVCIAGAFINLIITWGYKESLE